VKLPIYFCRGLYHFMCPCLLDNPGKKKVAKGILTLDADGDMYPDDFEPRSQPELTEEEEDSRNGVK
jgi:hypothetical protein